MADVTFYCTGCSHKLEASPMLAGMVIRCPSCSRPAEIPSSSSPLPEQNSRAEDTLPAAEQVPQPSIDTLDLDTKPPVEAPSLVEHQPAPARLSTLEDIQPEQPRPRHLSRQTSPRPEPSKETQESLLRFMQKHSDNGKASRPYIVAASALIVILIIAGFICYKAGNQPAQADNPSKASAPETIAVRPDPAPVARPAAVTAPAAPPAGLSKAKSSQPAVKPAGSNNKTDKKTTSAKSTNKKK